MCQVNKLHPKPFSIYELSIWTQVGVLSYLLHLGYISSAIWYVEVCKWSSLANSSFHSSMLAGIHMLLYACKVECMCVFERIFKQLYVYEWIFVCLWRYIWAFGYMYAYEPMNAYVWGYTCTCIWMNDCVYINECKDKILQQEISHFQVYWKILRI